MDPLLQVASFGIETTDGMIVDDEFTSQDGQVALLTVNGEQRGI